MKIIGLWLLMLAGVLADNAFFAMDTGISGEPAAVAATLSELGFDGLGGSPGSIGPMASALEERGQTLVNVYSTLSFTADSDPVTPQIEAWLKKMGGHRTALWLAIKSVEGTDQAKVATEAIRKIAGTAAAEGVEVSLYPHAGFWLERFSGAAELARSVDRENIGVTFNLCHWLKVEGDVDPLPVITENKTRLQFVTINGADGGDTRSMGWDRLIQPLGQGSYDVSNFIRQLKHETGWTGPVGLQLFGVKGDQRENLSESIAAWRAMTGTLEGKVLCGYQGWFRCEGDGSGLGWRHYGFGGDFRPGKVGIEMWPDVGELSAEERFATPFRHADGSVAKVFSSVNEPTVLRHFKWMRDHGIDGIFLQRFATETRDERSRAGLDRVLANCRKGAGLHQRSWGLMYDLSGLKPGQLHAVEEDWIRLRETDRLGLADDSYLWLDGRPLVSLWGFAFSDRETDIEEWTSLVGFFHDQGCAVMLGVPYHWRTLDRDSIADPAMHDLLRRVQVISPWAVGRLATPEDAAARVATVLKPDREWCDKAGVAYLPVIFPGFSWHNLEKARGREAEFESIPRRGGEFMKSQALAAMDAGAKTLYVAMFDEMDEGTAIFKTSSNPPVGESPFLAEPDLPNDHYLRLTGELGAMLRGEQSATDG